MWDALPHGRWPLPQPGSPMRPSLADGESPAALSPWEGSPNPLPLLGPSQAGPPSGGACPRGVRGSSHGLAVGPLPGRPSDASRCLSATARRPAGRGGFRPAMWGAVGTGGRTKPSLSSSCQWAARLGGTGLCPPETMPGKEGSCFSLSEDLLNTYCVPDTVLSTRLYKRRSPWGRNAEDVSRL